jgi:hypothetical protein
MIIKPRTTFFAYIAAVKLKYKIIDNVFFPCQSSKSQKLKSCHVVQKSWRIERKERLRVMTEKRLQQEVLLCI